MKKMQKDPDMLEEYDFSKGIKGKYSQKYNEGTNVIVIEPDIKKYFPDHDSVNQARLLKNKRKLHNRVAARFSKLEQSC